MGSRPAGARLLCSLFGERHDADAGVAQSNWRIEALVTVICLALLIFCLVEREVRRAIAPTSPSRTSTSASRPSPPGG